MTVALALLATWIAPVDASVTRGFHYDPARPFAAGQRRGVLYASRAGDAVRAPCTGTVARAGAVAGRGSVALRCGRHRVTLLGVERITARGGQRVHRGRRVAIASGRVHLSARDERARFTYVDPYSLIAAVAPPSPAPPLARAPRTTPRPRQQRKPSPAPDPRAIAPWPAWLGLALLLGGVGARSRRIRTRRHDAVTRRGRAPAPG